MPTLRKPRSVGQPLSGVVHFRASLGQPPMTKRWISISCLFLSATCLLLPIAMADGMDDATILKELQETMVRVRTMNGPSMARTKAAEHLCELGNSGQTGLTHLFSPAMGSRRAMRVEIRDRRD